jgi:hypothetical protein
MVWATAAHAVPLGQRWEYVTMNELWSLAVRSLRAGSGEAIAKDGHTQRNIPNRTGLNGGNANFPERLLRNSDCQSDRKF